MRQSTNSIHIERSRTVTCTLISQLIAFPYAREPAAARFCESDGCISLNV